MMNQNKAVMAGAGFMGASLAQVYALAGYETWIYNRSESGLEKGKHLIQVNQEEMVREGLITKEQSDAVHEKIHYTTSKECFSDCCIVVESLVEQLDVKQGFFSEISRIVPDEALLASNTSGLHITDIASDCRYPERFMGQHWLNPPHLLPLCEIIAGARTSEENIRKMRELVKGLGKRPVVVADINGFIVNRIQFAMLREALNIVEMGAATAADIDNVLKAGMGIRYAALGPFGIVDQGGIDSFDNISAYLFRDLSDEKSESSTLKAMVERGELGVKSGKGFYDYSGDKAEEAIRNRDRKFIQLAKVLYFGKNNRI
ncbi:MAG: 3-hydroxyacyl-CoA dehydrogenase family protein [Lachnospiraceae bacterium]|nr:3-hydroxyacyl-CoA dehydrogenase family protein [Lachnospiraceae bacterium]